MAFKVTTTGEVKISFKDNGAGFTPEDALRAAMLVSKPEEKSQRVIVFSRDACKVLFEKCDNVDTLRALLSQLANNYGNITLEHATACILSSFYESALSITAKNLCDKCMFRCFRRLTHLSIVSPPKLVCTMIPTMPDTLVSLNISDVPNLLDLKPLASSTSLKELTLSNLHSPLRTSSMHLDTVVIVGVSTLLASSVKNLCENAESVTIEIRDTKLTLPVFSRHLKLLCVPSLSVTPEMIPRGVDYLAFSMENTAVDTSIQFKSLMYPGLMDPPIMVRKYSLDRRLASLVSNNIHPFASEDYEEPILLEVPFLSTPSFQPLIDIQRCESDILDVAKMTSDLVKMLEGVDAYPMGHRSVAKFLLKLADMQLHVPAEICEMIHKKMKPSAAAFNSLHHKLNSVMCRKMSAVSLARRRLDSLIGGYNADSFHELIQCIKNNTHSYTSSIFFSFT